MASLALPRLHGGKWKCHDFERRLVGASYVSFKSKMRRGCVHAEKSGSSEATTGELDYFIDKLRSTDSQQLPQFVAENVMAFDSNFWLRLATRSELCKSEDDKLDYEELASNVMQLVERIVKKTEEKIETSTDVLVSILEPVTGSQTDQEIVWPPRDPEALAKVRKELVERERGGFLDEGFLSEVSAQIRQAKEDADKPGLLALLQKTLQLYAATFLSKTSYAKRDGVVDKAEELLETIIKADSETWSVLITSGLELGGGEVKPEELTKAVKKRIERVLLRTDGGSYKQRVLIEYVKEIQKCVDMDIEACNA